MATAVRSSSNAGATEYKRWRAAYETDVAALTRTIADTSTVASLSEQKTACSAAIDTLNATGHDVEAAPTHELFRVANAAYEAEGAFLDRCQRGQLSTQAQILDLQQKNSTVAERVQEADRHFGVSD